MSDIKIGENTLKFIQEIASREGDSGKIDTTSEREALYEGIIDAFKEDNPNFYDLPFKTRIALRETLGDGRVSEEELAQMESGEMPSTWGNLATEARAIFTSEHLTGLQKVGILVGAEASQDISTNTIQFDEGTAKEYAMRAIEYVAELLPESIPVGDDISAMYLKWEGKNDAYGTIEGVRNLFERFRTPPDNIAMIISYESGEEYYSGVLDSLSDPNDNTDVMVGVENYNGGVKISLFGLANHEENQDPQAYMANVIIDSEGKISSREIYGSDVLLFDAITQ